MYLKQLELSGFKSFARKSALTFNAPITAIVGPNGSGKSNVAESFRFALGEQSLRSMRGKRGEDLIWNGSDESPRSARASVRLVFDNTKKVFDFDFDEVTLERIVQRDGTNEYYMNGSQVRLKDIIELLAKAHIGDSGHHIISQGEADRILRASIRERREMIEDALGLKIYQYKKEESLRKLKKTSENIAQVESLRREIAPHIRFLRKQVEKVQKAEETRVELANIYREYLRREQIYLDKERRNIDTILKPLKEREHELIKQMSEAKVALDTSLAKDKKSSELIAVEDAIQKCRTEKGELQREIGKIEGEIESNTRAIERTREIAHSEDSKVVKLRDVERLAHDIFQETERARGLSIVDEILSIVHTISKKLGDFIATYKDAIDTSLLDELVSRNIELGQKKNECDRTLTTLQEALTDKESTYRSLKNSIEQEKESGREAEKKIFAISSEQSEVRSQIEILGQRNERLHIEENDWKRECTEAGVLVGQAIIGFQNMPIDIRQAEEEDRSKQDDRRRHVEKMKIRLEELGGVENNEIMKEFKDAEDRDLYLSRELDDLRNSATTLQQLIAELDERIGAEFRHGIDKINDSFKKFFVTMFGGGNAELKVIRSERSRRRDTVEDSDTNEPEEEGDEGVDIDVTLPKKRIKGLDMLSGGERALTSIALLFAISQVNPPPFIILDETDAALDEANSKKYGDMIESLSHYSQLILITHNRETMSRAGVIYGVTMGSGGVSRLLSIVFDEAIAVAK